MNLNVKAPFLYNLHITTGLLRYTNTEISCQLGKHKQTEVNKTMQMSIYKQKEYLSYGITHHNQTGRLHSVRN